MENLSGLSNVADVLTWRSMLRRAAKVEISDHKG